MEIVLCQIIENNTANSVLIIMLYIEKSCLFLVYFYLKNIHVYCCQLSHVNRGSKFSGDQYFKLIFINLANGKIIYD